MQEIGERKVQTVLGYYCKLALWAEISTRSLGRAMLSPGLFFEPQSLERRRSESPFPLTGARQRSPAPSTKLCTLRSQLSGREAEQSNVPQHALRSV
jgi:hypothetical protein